MEHTTPPPVPGFITSPLGIAALMLVSSIGGGWLKDRLGSETRDSSSVVRIEALDTRINALQSALTDYQRGALSSSQFAEFRTANDKRLDDIRSDLRDVLAMVNTTDRQAARLAGQVGAPAPRAR